MALNGSWFKVTPSKTRGFEAYEAQHPRSTMVLFSNVTRTPLAALVFLPAPDPVTHQPSTTLSVLTAREPNSAQGSSGSSVSSGSSGVHFQGLLNRADQAFQFTICNLNVDGLINFNILHTPHRVAEVDPGPTYGINQVNELRPNQCYTIPVDQRTGQEMILSGLVQDRQGQKVALTVGEDEHKEVSQRRGLYFHLSVCAQSDCPSLVDRFREGTTWKCVSHFVRKVPVPKTKGVPRRLIGLDRLEGFDPSAEEDVAPVVLEEQRETLRRVDTIPMGGDDNDLMGEDAEEEDNPDDGGFMLFGAQPDRYYHQSATRGSATRGPVSDPRVNLACACAAAPQTAAGSASFHTAAPLAAASSAAASSAASAAASSVAGLDVGKSQAGKLTYGRAVEVRSGFTGKEYAYEAASAPVTLGLSICPGLQFLPLPDVSALLQAELEEWMKNQGQALIAALRQVFKSENCVVDLEHPPDTIILQCGHQCLHSSNVRGITKCPLCREPVMAFLREDGSPVGS